MPRRRGRYRRPKNWPENLKLRTLESRVRELEARVRNYASDVRAAEHVKSVELVAREQLGYDERYSAVFGAYWARRNLIVEDRSNYLPFHWLGRNRFPSRMSTVDRLAPEARQKLSDLESSNREELASLEREVHGRTLELLGPEYAGGVRKPPEDPPPMASLKQQLQVYRDALEKKAAKQRVALDEQQRLRAVKAAYEGKTRQEGAAVRKRLAVAASCPYCGRRMDATTSHADHIYPVALGGQSRPENMVYVCSHCNLGKRDKTVRQFLQEQGIDREDVEARLEAMGKLF